MAYIRQIPPDQATGALKRIFDEAIARAGKVWGILRVQSLNPGALEASTALYKTLMFPAPSASDSRAGGPGSPDDAARRSGVGPSQLTRVQREMQIGRA